MCFFNSCSGRLCSLVEFSSFATPRGSKSFRSRPRYFLQALVLNGSFGTEIYGHKAKSKGWNLVAV